MQLFDVTRASYGFLVALVEVHYVTIAGAVVCMNEI